VSTGLRDFLRHKALNGWGLFALITLPMGVSMVMAMLSRDLSAAEHVSSMIAWSVRWSVPWLLVAFAASSLQVLFPSEASKWLLRNRKFFGLCFAAGMAWQASFIIWLVTLHRDYYVEEVYVLRDVIEGVFGYLFLIAMTITSFKAGRSMITAKQWRLLHTVGIYFLWAYVFATYWYSLYYYSAADWVDYLYYWGGVLAWSLRIAAWSKKKALAAAKAGEDDDSRPGLVLVGGTLVALGLVAAALGRLWEEAAHANLEGLPYAAWLDLYMPYWPFIPYLPLFVMIPGAYLFARYRRRRTD